MTERMSHGARAGRGAVGRLLLLALGLMHLLAHAGSAVTSPEHGTATHTHGVHQERTAQDETAPPLATATDEHGDHGTWNAAELGLCAVVIGCCALLTLSGRRLHRRRARLLLQLRRRIQAAWSSRWRPSRPGHWQGVDLTQLAVLRI